jgi:hypothetical protein
VHRRLLAVGARLGVDVPVERWSPEGHAIDAPTHLERLEELVRSGGEVAVATDGRQLEEMVEVAGPIVAWTEG